MSLITLNDVNFSYFLDGNRIKILDNINLEINKGDMLAITGPSGSGKSTLLYILAGLLKPDSGQIIVDSYDLCKVSNFELAKIRNQKFGFIFQQFHLLSKTSVLDNVLMPCVYPLEDVKKIPEQKKQEAIKIIDNIGLSQRIEHHPNQLSGGQQQRVAIARALINDAEIIIADEPTGNLDSQSSKQILDILKQLNQQGRTIILVTHDHNIANQCPKLINIIDGKIENQKKNINTIKNQNLNNNKINIFILLQLIIRSLPLVKKNITSHLIRSLLTMLGITVGVAALFAMITIGFFVKDKIIESYSVFGINTLSINGYPDYFISANVKTPVVFRKFSVENDIEPLLKVFPEIELISPMMYGWRDIINFGGKTYDKAKPLAGNEQIFDILNRNIVLGNKFNKEHVKTNTPVCVLGYDVVKELFARINPIGHTISITPRGYNAYSCRVIGVIEDISGTGDHVNPNELVYVPYTYYTASNVEWYGRIHNIVINLKQGSDVELVGKAIESFFKKKYGKSGKFKVDSKSILLAQMKKFLNLFTLMLAAVALITMGVGGVGITNMMLVSLSERYKEIGISKAVGATDFSIRIQFLTESLIVCLIAGFIGLLLGFVFYQSSVLIASRLVPTLNFEWIFMPTAFFVSVISILVVGVLSGILPALKAEKLDIVEALRSE